MKKFICLSLISCLVGCASFPQPIVTNVEALGCILAASELMKVTGDSSPVDMQAVADMRQVVLSDVQDALMAKKKAAHAVALPKGK